MFKLLHLNINGLRNKLNDLKVLIVEEQPNIVTLNETKLSGNMTFNIEGYTTLSMNRPGRTCGGGIATLIRNDTKYSNVQKHFIEKHEILKVSIHSKSEIIDIVNCYIPPKLKLNQEIMELLSNENTIIVGDLNAKNTRWGSTINNNKGKVLETNLENWNLETYKMPINHINYTTNKKEVVDIILTHKRRSFKIKQIDSLNEAISDHLPIIIHIENSSKIGEQKNIKLYHKIDKKRVNDIFDKRNREKAFTINEIDQKVIELHKMINEIEIPTKKVPCKNLGFNKETRNNIKKRRKIKNLLNKNKNNNGLKNNLKNINKEIKNGIEKEKKKQWEYIKERVQDKKTSKESWNTIKKILNDDQKQKKSKNIRDENGIKIIEDQEIAEAFKERQQSIFKPNISNNLNEDKRRKLWYEHQKFQKRTVSGPYDSIFGIPPQTSFYETDQQITMQEVEDSLNKLKKDKSPGIYEINNKLLKTIKEEITPVLVELFNDCLNCSYFPESFKIAKIIMIPKVKNTCQIKDYRPISLLPTIGKLFEQIIANKIYKWAEEMSIINAEQSGFRKNRSTIDHLFQFIQDFKQSKNEKNKMHAVFIDFEKAFDKVNHVYLTKKLHDLNMPEDLLNIINSFLKNRKGFISYNKSKTEYFDIPAGVPQGSCLSPILFCLFVSDIPKPKGKEKLAQFADDIVAWAILKYLWENDLEKYVNTVVEWCLFWGLKVNITKTKHMNLGNCKKEVKINGKKLKNTKETKFLGLTIDHKLTLNAHITQKINSCYHLIPFLNNLKIEYEIPQKKNISLYKTLVRSKLEYGHIALLGAAKCHIKALEVMQNKFLRIILGRNRRTPIIDLLHDANIKSIEDRLKYLAKGWYTKALTNPNHPLVLNQNNYAYSDDDRVKTLYNILQNL